MKKKDFSNEMKKLVYKVVPRGFDTGSFVLFDIFEHFFSSPNAFREKFYQRITKI